MWRISIVGLKHLRSVARDADNNEIVYHIVQVIKCWFQTNSYQTLEALRASFVLPYVWNQDPSRWWEDSLSWCCIPGKQSRCQERCSSSPDWNSPQDQPWFLVYMGSLFLFWKNPKLIYLAAVVRLNRGQERTDLEQFQSAFSVLSFGEGISWKRGQIQALQSVSVVWYATTGGKPVSEVKIISDLRLRQCILLFILWKSCWVIDCNILSWKLRSKLQMHKSKEGKLHITGKWYISKLVMSPSH